MIKIDEKTIFYIPTYISWQNILGKTYIINEIDHTLVVLKGKLSLVWNSLNENLEFSKFVLQEKISKIDRGYLENVIQAFISSDILGVE